MAHYLDGDPVKLQQTVRRHKRENELSKRREKRAEPALKKLHGGHNVLEKAEFVALVEWLYYENNGTARRVLREGRFALGKMTVEVKKCK